MSEENETNETNEAPSVADRKKAEIGYFDGELKTIPFNDGDSIQTLIDKAELNFGDGQSINDQDGEDVEITAQAEADKTYYVVGNYKQGNLL